MRHAFGGADAPPEPQNPGSTALPTLPSMPRKPPCPALLGPEPWLPPSAAAAQHICFIKLQE